MYQVILFLSKGTQVYEFPKPETREIFIQSIEGTGIKFALGERYE